MPSLVFIVPYKEDIIYESAFLEEIKIKDYRFL